jgi:hypothetical protein
MALLHIDGFDTYDSDGDLGLAYDNVNLMLWYDGGRFSSSIGKIGGNRGRSLRKRIGSNITTVYTGFAVYLDDVYSTRSTLIIFQNSSIASQFYVAVEPTGAIAVIRGSTVLSTSASDIIKADIWQYIAVKAVINDSVGACEVWLNGSKVIDISGVDTKDTSIIGCDYVTLQSPVGFSYFDDWYIADDSGTTNNTLITEARVVPLVPTADTAQKDFTASTGSDNYAMVDEDGMDSDTTYVTATSNGSKDIYDVSDLPVNPVTVYGVSCTSFARKLTTYPSVFNYGIVSNGVESFSTGNVLSSDYIGNCIVYNTNPDGNIAWNTTSINSLQCGFEITY